MKRLIISFTLILIMLLPFATACDSAQSVESQLEIVEFDKQTLIEELCAHTRAYDSQFIINFVPSATLESDIEDAIKTAQSTRFDCAYNTDSVVWTMIDHKSYVYTNFKIMYSGSVGPRPPVMDIESINWQHIVEDMLQKRQMDYSICIPASQTDAKQVVASIKSSFDNQSKALFSYEIENSNLSLLSYEDYLVPTISLIYRENALLPQDIYSLDSLYAGSQYIMDSLSDGSETLTLSVHDLSKDRLQLLLWASQINDSADMIEEALSGKGDYYDDDDGSYIAVLSIQYSGTKEKREQCRLELKNVLLDIDAELSEQKAKDQSELYQASCNAVADRAEYDYEMSEASVSETLTPEMRYLRTAYGALCEGRAVCTSYAAAFKAICDRLSLPCWVVMGYYEDGGHAWNAVLLNGEIRYVDPTFYDISKSNMHILFTPEEYAARPYLAESGYVMPDWYTQALA